MLATLTHFTYATGGTLAQLHCLVGNTSLNGISGGSGTKVMTRVFTLSDRCKFFLDGVQVGMEALKTNDRLEIEGRPAVKVVACRKM